MHKRCSGVCRFKRGLHVAPLPGFRGEPGHCSERGMLGGVERSGGCAFLLVYRKLPISE